MKRANRQNTQSTIKNTSDVTKENNKNIEVEICIGGKEQKQNHRAVAVAELSSEL